MARRKEIPLTSFSSVLRPDGSRVRTDELPPEEWAAKKKEMAAILCKTVKYFLEMVSTAIPPALDGGLRLTPFQF